MLFLLHCIVFEVLLDVVANKLVIRAFSPLYRAFDLSLDV